MRTDFDDCLDTMSYLAVAIAGVGLSFLASVVCIAFIN